MVTILRGLKGFSDNYLDSISQDIIAYNYIEYSNLGYKQKHQVAQLYTEFLLTTDDEKFH